MKKNNANTKSVKAILFYANRLQNNSTKKKQAEKSSKVNNTKPSITNFDNTTIVTSKPSFLKVQRSIYRASSYVNSKPNPSTSRISSATKFNSKNSVTNINITSQKYDISLVPIRKNKKLATSLINNQISNKNMNNILYSPSSSYTPSISSNQTYIQSNSFKSSISSRSSRINPSAFNPFVVPPIKKEVVDNSQIYKHLDPQEKFNQKMNLLIDNVYKEVSKLVKNLTEIEYNKGISFNEANVSYLKQLKELYDKKEKKMIQVFDKYKYDLNNLKYRERRKYLEMYKNKTQEIMEIENNFNFEKEQIKATFQIDYDLIKQREEIEVKNLLDKKLIEIARNKLLNVLDNY